VSTPSNTHAGTASRPAPGGGAPRLGDLLRSEILRARSRRSLRWLSVLALLAVVGVSAIMWFTSARVTADDLSAAADTWLAEQQQYYEACLVDPMIPEAERDNWCYQPNAADAQANALWALPKRPFDRTGLEGLVGFAGGIGLLVAVMLAATSGGADWGARTMSLLLSWEPRRTRVFLVRLGVVVGVALALEAVLVAVALGLGSLIANSHGLVLAAGSAPPGFEGPDLADAGELALRWLPLAALGAAGSFAVAMLTRSTGWAIGALIGFVAVVESIVQGLWPWGSQWLLQTNGAAWLSGGLTWLVDRAAAERASGTGGGAVLESEGDLLPGYILITDIRGLTTLTVLVLAACAVSWISLRRRDVE
jgi:ABC-2 type transport system permease protein